MEQGWTGTIDWVSMVEELAETRSWRDLKNKTIIFNLVYHRQRENKYLEEQSIELAKDDLYKD